MTAPVGDVTTPIRRGRNGSGRLRAGVEQPLGAQPLLELLERQRQRARARSARSSATDIWNLPRAS